jgi:hypothetical protein
MDLFKAALTPELRLVVAQQEQETITIKRMYQVATTAQREFKGKGPALVNVVRDEEIMTENETDDVAAFNEGPGPKPIKPVDKTEETTFPDEEAVVNAAFLFFETSKLWVLFSIFCILDGKLKD